MSDLTVTSRLRARIEISAAEIRTLEALPLQPRARTLVSMSKAALIRAVARLASQPDNLELEYLGRRMETVESQLRIVRASVTVIKCPEPTARRSTRTDANGRRS
jgi:hypothetical protein